MLKFNSNKTQTAKVHQVGDYELKEIQLSSLVLVYFEDGSTEWRAEPQEEIERFDSMYQEHLDSLGHLDYYDSAWY